MKSPLLNSITLGLAIGALAAAPAAWAEGVSGTISFLATTNVKMFKISGEAKQFSGQVARKGMTLSSLEVRIPVSSLKTGMEIRDKHMRERVFTAADGTEPDVVFKSAQSVCKPAGTAQACEVSGTLAFRGVAKPFRLDAAVEPADPSSLRVKAHVLVDMLDFGVEPAKLKWTNLVVERNAVVDLDVVVK